VNRKQDRVARATPIMAATDTHDQQAPPNGSAAYSPKAERPPLATYAALSAGFVTAFGGSIVAWRRSGRELPERVPASDMALIGAAAFKLSRLITKEKVTAFVRAPFTQYRGKGSAPGEVEEEARGHGPRAAVGQLLTCPYCIGLWIVSAFTLGLVTLPRETRLVASVLATLGLTDFLQLAYRAGTARKEPARP
jgi:Protein of unknown function (DUF1360)